MKTMTSLHTPHEDDASPSMVTVQRDAIVLNGFRETDTRVLEAVTGSADPEQMVHLILELGGRCISDTTTLLQTQAVAAEVDRLQAEIGTSIARGTEVIAETAAGLLGEDGTLLAALNAFRHDLDQILDGTFDLNRKTSALSKLDDLLAAHGKTMNASLTAQLDLTQPNSPLVAIQDAILDEVNRKNQLVMDRLTELSKDLAVKRARLDESERGTRKGRAYEDVVYGSVQERANFTSDVAEQVGEQTGAVPGSKIGDVVVTLDPEDAFGHFVRFVVEAKDRDVSSLPKMLAELDEALKNREALVAIASFSSQDKAPTRTPIETFDGGTKVIVVAEKGEDGDLTPEGEAALRLACAWARLMVLRSLRAGDGSGTTIDLDLVASALGNARMGLASAKAIRSAHSRARKGIDEASDHLGTLCREIEASLSQIEAEAGRLNEMTP